MPDSNCPYCGELITPPPKRQRACPKCKKKICVRVDGSLITEDEASILGWLLRLNIDREAFDNRRGQLGERFGHTASVNDTIWSLLNSNLSENAYRYMAMLAESEGKDPNPYILQAQKFSLMMHKKNGVKSVAVYCRAPKPTCAAYLARAGRTMSVDAALGDLVGKGCPEKSRCVCFYAAKK